MRNARREHRRGSMRRGQTKLLPLPHLPPRRHPHHPRLLWLKENLHALDEVCWLTQPVEAANGPPPRMPHDTWEKAELQKVRERGRFLLNRALELHGQVDSSHDILEEKRILTKVLMDQAGVDREEIDTRRAWRKALRVAKQEEEEADELATRKLIDCDQAYDNWHAARRSHKSLLELIWTKRLTSQRGWAMEIQQRLITYVYKQDDDDTIKDDQLAASTRVQEGGSSSSSGQ